MPLSSRNVGATGDWAATEVDARATMAFAAGLGETSECYFDTLERPDVLAHPMFPVGFEWPVLLGAAGLPGNGEFTPDERVRGVHFSHDLVIHRPIRAGMQLRTRARVAAARRHRAGACQVVLLETIDAADQPVCSTWYGSLYRGVELIGAEAAIDDLPADPAAAPKPAPTRRAEIEVSAGLAHVYTECARIWNPIHTDAAVAARAGLPGIILHGTATLGLAVSEIIRGELDGDPRRVGRIAGRFGAMVPIASVLTLRVYRDGSETIRFEVENARGEAAIRGGWISIREAARGPDR